jgi:hypothetical protein
MIPARAIVISCSAGLALLVASLIYQHTRGPHGLDPAVRDSVTALRTSQRADSVQHAEHRAAADSDLAASHAASAASVATMGHAAVEHARATRAAQLADSNAVLARASATARDSAEHFRVAFENEHDAFTHEQKRGDSLEIALTSQRAATAKAEASARENQIADSVSQFRLARVEASNASLVREAARLSGDCQILPFIPCPSRTVGIIGGVVAGGVIGFVIANNIPHH